MVEGSAVHQEHAKSTVSSSESVDKHQRRSPFRLYSWIVAASIVPLVIAIVVLTVYQFQLQRGQLLEELRNEVIAQDVLLASVTKTVRDHVRGLETWAEIYLAELRAPSRSAEQRVERRVLGSRLFSREALAERPGADAELTVSQRLVPHMRLAHRAMPYLRRSYYLSGAQDFAHVFPMHEGADFGGRLRGASNDELLDVVFEQDLFQHGLPANNGSGRDFWTGAYLDPAGAGWVVAHAAPIATEQGFAGVVGSTVHLDFLTGFLRAFGYATGRVWLVNPQEQILAASSGPILTGLSIRTLQEVLPPSWRSWHPPPCFSHRRDFGRLAINT